MMASAAQKALPEASTSGNDNSQTARDYLMGDLIHTQSEKINKVKFLPAHLFFCHEIPILVIFGAASEYNHLLVLGSLSLG